MIKRLTVALCAILMISLVAASGLQRKVTYKVMNEGPPKSALDVVTADGILNHIKVLASDEFEGRGPGTHGEDLSINYIADQFKKVGLAPGNTDGTYFQKVPLVGIST